MYELAREGQIVERKPRKVTIYEIDIIHTQLEKPHPRITFRVSCSKGTYIRTLCEDIGKRLGLPSVMGTLVRTRTGPFDLSNCVTLSEVEDAVQNGRFDELLIETDRALVHMPEFSIDSERAGRALNGQKLIVDDIPTFLDQQLIRLYEEGTNRFLGIFQYDQKQRLISPVKVFQR